MGEILSLVMDSGTPDGTMKVSLAGWDCSMYRINRKDLLNYTSDDKMKMCGIYFLIGESNRNTLVYVGQANSRVNGKGLLGRVLEHDKPTEAYWNEAFLIYSCSNTLYATELNYLERVLWEKLCKTSKTVMNASRPALGNCSELTKLTMNKFIEGIEKMMGVFYKDFLKPADPTLTPQKDTKQFFIKKTGGKPERSVDAICEIRDSKYVVLKGSLVATEPHNPNTTHKYWHDKYGAFIGTDRKLTQDVVFNSPSGASAFAIYGSSDGKVDWKDSDKRPLKDFL